MVSPGKTSEETGTAAPFTVVDPLDPTRRKHMPTDATQEDLLVPVFRNGQLVYKPPELQDLRKRTKQQLNMLHPGLKRFVNPHQYVAGLELGLHELKSQLVLNARRETPEKC